MKKLCLGLLIFIVVILIVATGQCLCSESAHSGTLVTLHYADWCPHCRNMKPVWDQVKADIKMSRPDIHFREIDEQKTPTPGINGLPTILLLDPRGRRYKYPGEPNPALLKRWILAPTR